MVVLLIPIKLLQVYVDVESKIKTLMGMGLKIVLMDVPLIHLK